MLQASAGAPNDGVVDTPPPAYSPRCIDENGVAHSVEDRKEPPSVSQFTAVERTAPRPLLYEVPVPEQEVNAYEYRPTRRATRRPTI